MRSCLRANFRFNALDPDGIPIPRHPDAARRAYTLRQRNRRTPSAYSARGLLLWEPRCPVVDRPRRILKARGLDGAALSSTRSWAAGSISTWRAAASSTVDLSRPIRTAPIPRPRRPDHKSLQAEATTCRSPGSVDCPGFIFVAVNGLSERLIVCCLEVTDCPLPDQLNRSADVTPSRGQLCGSRSARDRGRSCGTMSRTSFCISRLFL
jgi:hypothetical protein